ncbi:hypothetical protein CRD_00606 [Raphidiopsis brookii D9]|nr:hypothetical protein CRD_00606 [Raphidiopsis brookii D9]
MDNDILPSLGEKPEGWEPSGNRSGRLFKSAAIALWKRVFKKSFCNLPLTLKTPWLRWWDNRGNLLLTGNERAEDECRGFYHPHHR